ncbi:hypothetical protein L0F63_001283 [Massospora cicadina]|nr:hypothetical protein L0F63_001283 [Massospora cicadina]
MRQAFLNWLPTISEHHPNVKELVAVAFLSIAGTNWIKNSGTKVADYLPECPIWFGETTVDELLGFANLTTIDEGMRVKNDSNYIDAIRLFREASLYLTDTFQLSLEQYVKVKRLTNSLFGTEAQLIEVEESTLEEERIGHPINASYNVPGANALSRDVFRVKAKGLARFGLSVPFGARCRVF